ncbi:MAG: DUF1800 family protein [Planctomycetota bacterium]
MSDQAHALSRRLFLSGGLSGAAAVTFAAMWGRSATGATFAAPFSPASERLRPRSNLLTLANRLTFGFHEAELPPGTTYTGYLAARTAPPVPDVPSLLALIDGLDLLDLLTVPPSQFRPTTVVVNGQTVTLSTEQVQRLGARALAHQILYYSVLSTNQFRERLLEFWRDHFNVYADKSLVGSYLPLYDRSTLRPNAVGPFPTLLESVAKSAAMSLYLDNWLNRAPQPAQENYARELLELHTMGPQPKLASSGNQPNYSENDVRELAKILSGWGGVVGTGQFRFIPQYHHGGDKILLGLTAPFDGNTASEGETVLRELSRTMQSNPALVDKTAELLAWKLTRWFLADSPPDAVVIAAKNVYLATDGDVVGMVRSILDENNVAALTAGSGGPEYKFRRPSQWLAALLRALQLDTTHFTPTQLPGGLSGELIGDLYSQGNLPYAWPAPDGYPDGDQAWASAIFGRWALAQRVFSEQPQLVDLHLADGDIDRAYGPNATTDDELVARVDQVLTGGVMTDFERAALKVYAQFVRGYTGTNPPYTVTVTRLKRELLMLGSLTPTFQHY